MDERKDISTQTNNSEAESESDSEEESVEQTKKRKLKKVAEIVGILLILVSKIVGILTAKRVRQVLSSPLTAIAAVFGGFIGGGIAVLWLSSIGAVAMESMCVRFASYQSVANVGLTVGISNLLLIDFIKWNWGSYADATAGVTTAEIVLSNNMKSKETQTDDGLENLDDLDKNKTNSHHVGGTASDGVKYESKFPIPVDEPDDDEHPIFHDFHFT